MRWASFSVMGLLLAVAIYIPGYSPTWALYLAEYLAQPPFLLPLDAPALSPGMAFLLDVILTLALTYNLLLIRSAAGRFFILFTFLILLACFTPVLALWGIFYNGISAILACAAAGLLAALMPHKTAQPEASAPANHE